MIDRSKYDKYYNPKYDGEYYGDGLYDSDSFEYRKKIFLDTYPFFKIICFIFCCTT